MLLSATDLAIVALYMTSMIAIGLYLRRRAARNLESYYLGDRSLPWYVLSLSNASGMYDVSGTMWLVTLCFVYGLKSIWLPWLWPIFNQIFLMAYLSTWLRRSNVLTGAEWIRTRFGDGLGSRLSHLSVVLFALISVFGFLAYGFVGIGKFIEVFLPWEHVSPFVPFAVAPEHVANFYGIVFTGICTIYIALGGMLGVVWTEVVQYMTMAVSAVIIGVIAMARVSPATLHAVVPAGWDTPFFGWQLGLDWSKSLPAVMSKVEADGFSAFGAIFMLMLFKGILVSAAGPAPNFDMQRILATRSARDAALMSGGVSVILNPLRYFMVAGFAVLALAYHQRLHLVRGGQVDFENILPAAMAEFLPAGILGLMMAGLLAAFMASFAAAVNAAPAYVINDVYKRYINPQASRAKLIYASYGVSVLVVVISTFIGLTVHSINSVLIWLVAGLWGGYIAPNILKWHWWRFNGAGYFAGMISGIVCALAFPPLFRPMLPTVAPDIQPLYIFPAILLVSACSAVAVSLLTPPDDPAVVASFYRTVRPWGAWGPVRDRVMAADPRFEPNRNFRRDAFNVVIGTIWQIGLVALPIYLVMRNWVSFGAVLAIIAVTSLILKRSWYDRLEADAPAHL
jgi:SSS family solute:Na+ symporter